MKKVIKYAVLNENQYTGGEGYDVYQLCHKIVTDDMFYTLTDYIYDYCDNLDIETLDNGDVRVGTDYYILIDQDIII
jgi:hypothetical protein